MNRSTTMEMTRILGLVTTLGAGSSCVDEDIDAPSNYETGDASGSGGVCEPVAQDGEWDPVLVEWSDPGEPGDPAKVGYEDMQPHHNYMTTVHAAHLPSGELILFHGQGEQRVWPIGFPAADMRWHPLPFTVPRTNPDLCSYNAGPPEARCYADLFCAGHVVLPDGRFFVAGGNVTGSPSGGGLVNTYTYNPEGADADEAPFGWAEHDSMAVDRWYPSVTVIPGSNPAVDAMGRVLISSGASRVPGGQNTFEIFDPNTNLVTQIAIDGVSPFDEGDPIPLYPFIFVLPNGDILYAGGEGAPDAVQDGRVLVPDYNNGGQWEWHGRVFQSEINGGSAVMYEPGKILKSGGVHRGDNNPPGGNIADVDDIAEFGTETIDLSTFASGDYATAPDFTWVERQDMNRARHLHTLTVLPDGRVAATGGNTRSNGIEGDHPENECNFGGEPIGDEQCNDADGNGVPDGNPATGCPAVPSPCEFYDPDGEGGSPTGFYCRFRGNIACTDSIDCGIVCTQNSDCPPGSVCGAEDNCEMPCPAAGTCGAVVHCGPSRTWCDPGNNACFATQSTEIWEPACGTWTEVDTQQRPRMYHSTALLIPDKRVVSMGGGHRQGLAEQANLEYFTPEYGAVGTANEPEILILSETDMEFDHPALPWDGEANVLFTNGSASVVADYFTLVRLGSVTHQFDMDQRFMSLGLAGDVDVAGSLTVAGPASSAIGPAAASAPPGYYMLFLRGTNGELSDGQYVKVGPSVSMIHACPATSQLVATETSCTVEPIGGVCPTGFTQQNAVDLPIVDGVTGPIEGWHVLVPAGEIDDPLAPSADELAALDARCVAACEEEFEGDVGVAANCDDPAAFDAPLHMYDDAPGPYDLVLATQKQGQGIFGTQSLTCDLDSTCYAAFDEDLAPAMPDRTTPANDLLGIGEEYRVALGTLSKLEIITNLGTYSSRMTGSVGYSFCRDGSATAPCPFYLGSFEALASATIRPKMTCADGTQAQPSVSNIVMKLSQPAFGIAHQGTTNTSKGFPKGGLIFESSFNVGTVNVASRRPSRANATLTASGTTFNASNLTATMTVPCNTSTAAITVRVTARDPGNGSALGKPPVVTNTTSATGTCGAARALTATVTDPNGDAGPLRWKVDGVLLAPGTSTMVVTGTHTLEAVVRDARGATTTGKKVVSCS